MNSSPFLPLHNDLETVLAHVIQDFMRAMKQRGLSTPQIYALMYIFHAGECQVSDIGDLADASNAAASQMVERLVQQGLVDRREDPKDRRYKLVTLSEKGKDLFHESVMSNQYLMEIMAILSLEQRQAVHDAFMLLAQTGRQIQNKSE
jgi:DNA-binding MarR family transcriptional regulator